MGNLFNMDNPFFATLTKIYDIMFLSLLWMLFCIPIITIGPATTAMYYAVVKVIRKERGYLFREFFKAFRLNFKKGAIVGVILSILFGVILFDISYAVNALAIDATKGSLMIGVFLALAFLLLSFITYVFPILSRFEMTLKQLIKAAVYMSMRHLHFTVLMVVVTLIAFYGVYIIPIAVFIIPALSMVINSFMMEKVFKKYMPQTEGDPEETGKDEWYLD